jgi:chromosomal replication initiation ATPase DnaA
LVRRGKGKEERQVAIYLSKAMRGQTSKEIGRYFGIKGPAVSEVIKGIEGRWDEEI